ncbi:MAG: alpha/beta hydrolase [Flavobacteriaceae bacterium]
MGVTRLFFLILTLYLLPFGVDAQDTFNLWKNETKPFYKENNLIETEKEAWGTKCVLNITEPTLTIYKAKGENSGKAVVVVPGGGYEVVAMYHEGHEVAEALSKAGITAGVLKYRIPLTESSDQPERVPLSDLRKALKTMHSKANIYGIKNNEIGVMGFSAGSHLASVSGLWKSEDAEENPAFTALIYGVTNLTEGNQRWLENNLYHRALTEEEVAKNTLLNLVNNDTPPAFLVHSYTDDMCDVSETTLYAKKLFDHNVQHEMHLFPKGGHGFGIGKQEDGTDQWIGLFVKWLKLYDF